MTKELTNLYKMGGLFLLVATFLCGVYAYSELKTAKYIGLAPQNTIIVTGEGKVSAAPDIAMVSITTREVAKTTKEAQEKAAKKTSALKKGLLDAGVEEKDIKTASYMTMPKYYYNNSGKAILEGYETIQTDEVKVRNTDNVSKVLDLAASLNINEVSGPNFTIDDTDKLKDEAREKAIAEAKEKAEKLADQLGVDLVRIVSFSESGDYAYMPYVKEAAMSMSMARDASAPTAPTVSGGEQEIKSNVSITFEIR